MRWLVSFTLLVVLMPLNMAEQVTSQNGYVPKDGFVPNAQTAIAIAEAVLIPIYGRRHIHSERPFTASLKDGIWTVGGSLPSGYAGGVAVVELAKQDARIIRVVHYR
jgi:hypothetical protein